MKVHMVHIRNVRMRMTDRDMLMEMRVRLARWIKSAMGMLMMLIVDMRMGVNHRSVYMRVLMMLGEVEPHANRHEHGGHGQLRGHRLTEHNHGCRAPQKWRG